MYAFYPCFQHYFSDITAASVHIHAVLEFFSPTSAASCEGALRHFTKSQILDMTKLKAFADDKSNIAKMTISLFDRVENTVGKGENAGYQHFLFFPQGFPKPLF